ncbi:competence protein CoiA family protein [Rhodococcus sp. T7]|uniref:competence protein CoiA family protein n=1 Tax=Rhodococcus sp. T7 TaxID=627444 RepID=UPI001358354A|nr:competence protein CoiA family protein [Rhodococcus sp. T7]
MRYAIDLTHEGLIAAVDAARRPGYLCPCCCGQVHLRSGMEKIAHFAHNPGEGTSLCEEYHPGSSNYGYPGDPLADGGVPLYLHLDPDGGQWTLFIELDPLFSNESRRSMPSLLAFDGVELHRPGSRPRRVPAVSLWPGSGRSAMTVTPSRQRSKLRTISRWVTGTPLERWRRQLAGIAPHGVLFVPYRGGTFRRYDWSTPVYWGDRVIVVGSARSAPPAALNPVPLPAVPNVARH